MNPLPPVAPPSSGCPPVQNEWPNLSPWVETHWASADTSACELADWIGAQLRTAIECRGHAVLSVSGGKSPIPLFQSLSQLDLPWEQITVTLVDERQVSETHPASNARLVREHLLQGPARRARFVPMLGSSDGTTPHEWNNQINEAEHVLQELGPADVVLLGMGLDGHTASLFRQASEFAQAMDPHQTRTCMAMQLHPPPPDAPFHRISQTLTHLLRSRQLVLSIAGEQKRSVLTEALQDPASPYPIAALLHQRSTPLLLWITP